MGTVDPRLPKVPKTGPFASDRLDSWKEIARYLNRDVRTVQRWEETGGLPVYRRTEGRVRGAVFAYKSELDDWLRQSPPPPNGKEEQSARVSSPRWRAWWVLWVAVPVLILAVGGTVWRLVRSQPEASPVRTIQLTSYAGEERHPAWSSDGRQIAFAWNGKSQDNYDIYWISVINPGDPLRLTWHPGLDNYPAWSPDGSTIAFARWVNESSSVEALTVPVSGGPERKIYESVVPTQGGTDYFPCLGWTLDGKWIIGHYGAGLALHSVSPPGNVRPLTVPIARSAGDCCLSLAPDGKNLAFIRASTDGSLNLYVLQLNKDYSPKGEPRPLTNETPPVRVMNPMWTSDSRQVLYVTGGEGVRKLWRVPSDGSRAASQTQSIGPIGFRLALSPRGDRLAFQNNLIRQQVLRVELGDGMSVSPILSSSGSELYPEVSPNGKRIAFVSRRGGPFRVWVSDSDGSGQIYIAQTVNQNPGPARWSPGGDQVVFGCQNQRNDDICIVPAGGGAVRQVTRNPARDVLPSWSHDEKWIYYTSNRSGSFQVWKTPVDGTDDEPVQVTKGGGHGPVESPDGKTVYFARDLPSGFVFKVPSNGGEESQVGDFKVLGSQTQNFAIRKDGIYYLSSSDPDRWLELWLYRFSTGKSARIGRRIEKPAGAGLSVAPDGRWALLTAKEAAAADLWMVENFR